MSRFGREVERREAEEARRVLNERLAKQEAIHERERARLERQAREKEEGYRRIQHVNSIVDPIIQETELRKLLMEYSREHWKCGEIREEPGWYGKTVSLVYHYIDVHIDNNRHTNVTRSKVSIGFEFYVSGNEVTEVQVRSGMTNSTSSEVDTATLRTFFFEAIVDDLQGRRKHSQMPAQLERNARNNVRHFRKNPHLWPDGEGYTGYDG